jgi:DUF4097 and DUF4098 domain-containing protein YvlB
MSMQKMLAAMALALAGPAMALADEADRPDKAERKAERKAEGRTVEEHRTATSDARVQIESSAGSIRVVGWSKDEVAVTATLGRGAEGLQVSGEGGRVRVEVESRGYNPMRGGEADLEIHVPKAARLEIESYSASITVSDVTGTVQAESVNGSLSITGQPKEVKAETVMGEVEIQGRSERVSAESVNGRVAIRSAQKELEASSVNGAVEVSQSSLERGHLETVSGSIHYEGDLKGTGDLELESVSGDIEMLLPANVAAEFEVSTFNGSITNELGPQAEPKGGRHAHHKKLEFTTGSGGTKVTITTLSGEITLRKH